MLYNILFLYSELQGSCYKIRHDDPLITDA